MPRLSATGCPRRRQPAGNRLVGKPDRQAAAPPQAGIVGSVGFGAIVTSFQTSLRASRSARQIRTAPGSNVSAELLIPASLARALTEPGKHVRHRTSRYLNDRLEQDHRGIKSRCRPMLGLKSTVSATRYCRGYDELRNLLRCRSRIRQHVPAAVRRWWHMRKIAIVLAVVATD